MGIVGVRGCARENGAALITSTAARDTALGAAKPPGLWREPHQEWEDGEGGAFYWWRRVQERGALQWHRDRPNGFGFGRRRRRWFGDGLKLCI